MRTLTSNASTKANTAQGTEPIILLRVDWVGAVGTRYYSERAFTLGSITALPRIMQIGTLTSKMRQNNVGAMSVINFKLDDTSGEFKSVYDSVNIERTTATLYQHFDGNAEGDLTTLFSGSVTGPIEWDEGERTFSFSLETAYLQDQVGYAPDFSTSFGTSALAGGDGVDESCVGKMWPLVFGTVVKMPTVRVGKAPEASIVRQDGNTWILDNSERCPAGSGAVLVDGIYFYGTFVSNSFVVSQANYVPGYFQSLGIGTRDATDADYNDASVIWLSSYKSIVGMCIHIDHGTYTWIRPDGVAVGAQPYKAVYRVVKQVGKKLVLDRKIYYASGAENLMTSGTIVYASKEPQIGWPSPFDSQGSRNFKVIKDGGEVVGYSWSYGASTTLKVSGYMDTYICCENSGVSFYGAYAMKRGRLELIPSRYYNIVSHSLFGHSAAVAIQFPIPLEMYSEQGWSGDQVYVTMKGSTTSISGVISYLLSNYTGMSYSGGSVTAIGACNFAITSKQNAVKICEEIAYQAGLGLLITGNNVSLTDIAYQKASVMTIAESKVEAFSLKLKLSDTTDLYTKQTSTWKENWSKPDQRLVLSQNTSRYGTIENSVDYFAFSLYGHVYPSAYFWLNRRANIWKVLTFKIDTPGILLEVFDIVTIAFADTSLIGVASRTGMVSGVDYDVKTKTVEVTVVLPFAAGSTSLNSYFWLDGKSFPGGTAPDYSHIAGLDAEPLEEVDQEDAIDAEKASNSAAPAVITDDTGGEYKVDVYNDGYTDSGGGHATPTMVSVPVELQGPWEPQVGDQVTVTMGNKKAFVETNNPTIQTTRFARIASEVGGGLYSFHEWDPVAGLDLGGGLIGGCEELNASTGIAVNTIVVIHLSGSDWYFFFPVATCT